MVRGFALLGILLLNILGFGLHQAAYFDMAAAIGAGPDAAINEGVWFTIVMFFEGAMRALFSILFGAGVVLFLDPERMRGSGPHFARNFWLFVIGLIDALILLWIGDILMIYAMCGTLLYLWRNVSPRGLLIWAAVLIALMSAFYGVTGFGLGKIEQAAMVVQQADDPSQVSAETQELADAWFEMQPDFQPSTADIEEELAARRGSYGTAFAHNLELFSEGFFVTALLYLVWDALAMMLIGMALYKLGVLHGDRTRRFYLAMMIGGFAVGLGINGLEYMGGVRTGFTFTSMFPYAQFTYHFGRLGMAIGYMSLLILIVQAGALSFLRRGLAAVGRMALTNYIGQSVLGLVIFTGAGFGLVGQLSLWQLYGVVLGIWVVQIAFSLFWMARFRFGPLEWVWRVLTYGRSVSIRG